MKFAALASRLRLSWTSSGGWSAKLGGMTSACACLRTVTLTSLNGSTDPFAISRKIVLPHAPLLAAENLTPAVAGDARLATVALAAAASDRVTRRMYAWLPPLLKNWKTLAGR